MADDKKRPAPHVPRRKPSDIDVTVGRRLKLRRVLLGKTQAELAEQCFLSPQQVHKYEQGSSKMTSARLAQFGEALDVPISWFFDEIDREPGLPDDLMQIMSLPQNIRMISAFSDISDPALKQIIINFTESIGRLNSNRDSNSDGQPTPKRKIYLSKVK